MALITSLSRYILFDILRDWLDIEDVGKIDASFTNSTKRNYFLNCIKFGSITALKGTSKYVCISFLNWLSTRESQILKICVQNLSKNIKAAANSQNHLTSVHICNPITNNITLLLSSFFYQWDGNKCDKVLDFSVTGNNAINGSELKLLRFPNLTRCDFSGLPALNLELISSLFENAIQLTDLNLSQCVSLTNDFLWNLTTNCKAITSLNVSHCNQIDDRGMSYIEENYYFCLSSLDIGYCNNVAELDVMSLVEKCTQLTDLNIATTPDTPNSRSDDTLFKIGHCLGHLRSLDISGSSTMSDVGIEMLCAQCPLIERLVMCEMHSRLFSIQSCHIVARSLKNLSYVHHKQPSAFEMDRLVALCNGFDELTTLDIDQYIVEGTKSRNIIDAASVFTVPLEIPVASTAAWHPNESVYDWAPLRAKSAHITRLTAGIYKFNSHPEFDKLTDDVVCLVCACRQLTYLHLTTQWVQAELRSRHLIDIAKTCTLLTTLRLQKCSTTNIDTGFITLVTANRNLTCIDVSRSSITDLSVMAIAKQCPKLRQLNISHCSDVTDKSVRMLGTKCVFMTHLYNCWCVKVTVAAVKAVRQGCVNLVEFDFKDTAAATATADMAGTVPIRPVSAATTKTSSSSNVRNDTAVTSYRKGRVTGITPRDSSNTTSKDPKIIPRTGNTTTATSKGVRSNSASTTKNSAVRSAGKSTSTTAQHSKL